jgi:hypothetical protein
MDNPLAVLSQIFTVTGPVFISTSYEANLRSVLRDLARNPLIISVAAGLLASSAQLSLPLIFTTLAWLLGFEGRELGLLFLLASRTFPGP